MGDRNDGVCHVEIGAEVQSFSIKYPLSAITSSGNLFDSGALGIAYAYVGSQSNSIEVVPSLPGSKEVRISPSAALPLTSPISIGDLIRILSNVYLVSDVNNWPESINISTGYVLPKSGAQKQPITLQAYFTTPPSTCCDLSGTGNSAENFRSHISQNFDDSPFNESITVSRLSLTEPYENGDTS